MTQVLVVITLVVAIVLLVAAIITASRNRDVAMHAGSSAARKEIGEQSQIMKDLRWDLHCAEMRNTELGEKLTAALSRLDISEDILSSAKLALNVAMNERVHDLIRIDQLEADLAAMRIEIDEIKRTTSERIFQLEVENVALRKLVP